MSTTGEQVAAATQKMLEAIEAWNHNRSEYYRQLPWELRGYRADWAEFGQQFPMVLKHPLMYVITPEGPETLVSRWREKSEQVVKALAKGEIGKALLWYEKPYKLWALSHIMDNFPDIGLPSDMAYSLPNEVQPEFWAEALANAWILTEFPSREYSRSQLVEMFKRSGFIGPGDRARPPAHPITVWRGATKQGGLGLSWTTNRKKADWFAFRFAPARAKRWVFEYECPPDRILAMFDDRSEEEVVVNTLGLRLSDFKVHKAERVKLP